MKPTRSAKSTETRRRSAAGGAATAPAPGGGDRSRVVVEWVRARAAEPHARLVCGAAGGAGSLERGGARAAEPTACAVLRSAVRTGHRAEAYSGAAFTSSLRIVSRSFTKPATCAGCKFVRDGACTPRRDPVVQRPGRCRPRGDRCCGLRGRGGRRPEPRLRGRLRPRAVCDRERHGGCHCQRRERGAHLGRATSSARSRSSRPAAAPPRSSRPRRCG